MQRSNIEWTTFTANPIVYERKSDGKRVWACVKKSPGCRFCYAEALAKRYGKGAEFNEHEMAKLNVLVDMKQIRHMLTAKKVDGVQVDGSMVFIGDMTDVFGPWVPFELLDIIFAVFALRPGLIGQFLTKRPDRAREYLSTPDRCERVHEAMQRLCSTLDDGTIPAKLDPLHGRKFIVPRQMWADAPAYQAGLAWPLPNVWIGTSCERQDQADERLPDLLQTPAVVRFVSAEPLLGPLDLHRIRNPRDGLHASALQGQHDDNAYEFDNKLDWVIPGGESFGRPCSVGWIRGLVRQTRGAGVACFVKQLGSFVVDRNDAEFDGHDDQAWPEEIEQRDAIEHNINGFREEHQGAPVRIRLRSRKGGDMAEWPPALRVRELPEGRP